MKSRRSNRAPKSRRTVVVATILGGSLCLICMALVALAPSPLIPDPARTLLAEDTRTPADSMAALIETSANPASWQYIYIHHSRTPGGDLVSIGQTTGWIDHFVIGNGQGCGDGEVQVGKNWTDQQVARAPRGTGIAPGCITICLVGDFDQAAPTRGQMKRLGELVSALQKQNRIPGRNVIAADRAGASGLGRHFPMTALSQHILP